MNDIEHLVEDLVRDAAPVKPAPHPFRLSLVWLACSAAYIVVSLAISGLRPDLMHKFHQFWFDAELAALLLIFVTTTLSAAALSFPDLHQMRKLALAPAVGFALFVVVMFLSWRANQPPPPLPVHSFECTISITLSSILPAVWTFYTMRRYASTHQRWAGMTALLSAFSVGAIWLRLYELNDSIVHVIEWHCLPMLGIGLVGWWLGKALLKW